MAKGARRLVFKETACGDVSVGSRKNVCLLLLLLFFILFVFGFLQFSQIRIIHNRLHMHKYALHYSITQRKNTTLNTLHWRGITY